MTPWLIFLWLPLKLIWLGLNPAWLITTQPEQPAENHPPQVKITLTNGQAAINPGESVHYEITVSDPEDGESKYNEIPSNKVVMDIKYHTVNPSQSGINQIIEPEIALISEHDCFNCHMWQTSFVGPPLTGISAKYQATSIEQLVNSIRNGSVEKWGEEPMPPQVNVPEAEVRQLAEWILSIDTKQKRVLYPGLKGFFRTDTSGIEGYYELTASYKDQGINSDPQTRLTGFDRVILEIRSR